ncbi:KGP24-like protein [Mya arenaria]|uniref:KGP24-like protein n=1 Tax=Mya arenaria TaxID=6604 RepID=A0ABY7DKV2_MYAAR|nr:KGP24-like protein [Mya arenaria]
MQLQINNDHNRAFVKDQVLISTIVYFLAYYCISHGAISQVQINNDASRTIALKIMRKHQIVGTRQRGKILNEKKIMAKLRKNLIFMGSVENNTTRVYTGCVLEAFTCLHSKGVVYRDLKPENLFRTGRFALIAFGFAKKADLDRKNWTFCGSPE